MKRRRPEAAPVLADPDEASLLDLVDNVLNKGVVVTGDVVLGIAGVDLVYLRLSAVLCAIDRVVGRSGVPELPGARRPRPGLAAPRRG
jgi:hypothetical protein